MNLFVVSGGKVLSVSEAWKEMVQHNTIWQIVIYTSFPFNYLGSVMNHLEAHCLISLSLQFLLVFFTVGSLLQAPEGSLIQKSHWKLICLTPREVVGKSLNIQKDQHPCQSDLRVCKLVLQWGMESIEILHLTYWNMNLIQQMPLGRGKLTWTFCHDSIDVKKLNDIRRKVCWQVVKLVLCC